MISPGLALRGALLAVLLGAACATDEPPQLPPPPAEDPPADPVPEIVSSSEDMPVDVAVDERYVYWLNSTLVPDPHGPPLRRGSVVRWDKTSGERVVLAAIEDSEPVELDVSSTNVYWIELRGYLPGGYRELGHDRLLRIPKTGGPPEIVAPEQWFDEGPRDQVAIANGYVYWLSAGTSSGATGVVRRTTEDSALTVVETVADNLDKPTMLAASSTRLCFRTGDSIQNSTIWCMPPGGGVIDPIAHNRVPQDMLFFDDRLYWSEAGGMIEYAVPSRGATIETVPRSNWPHELTADATALFWTVGGTPSGYEAVKGFVDDTYTIIRESDMSSLRSPASDGVHVYFSEGGRVVRMPERP